MAQITESQTSSKNLSKDVVDIFNIKDLDPTSDLGATNDDHKVVAMKANNGLRENVLVQNVHNSYLNIIEPKANDELTGDKEACMIAVLAKYRQTLIEKAKCTLGYPSNLDFDYSALAMLQHFSINNAGDPFMEGNYGLHSRQFEVGVLDWFAGLWELEKDEYWGYITNGGTEGNLHGILIGREVFPDGIFYASKESHYSVFKAARMYRMECIEIMTLVSGEMDCADFKVKLLHNKGKPAIINVTIGTTVKGAVDDLDMVIQTLEESGFSHDQFYIHCDGALFGIMMPFVQRDASIPTKGTSKYANNDTKGPPLLKLIASFYYVQAPKVTFKKPIGSISVSGHKFIGCPMPCGIQITRMQHIKALSRNVEYLATSDATIMGSRNGHTPIFLWYSLNKKGYEGLQKEVLKCIRIAHYLRDRLKEAGISTLLNELSSTVVFERPWDEEFIRRWQLACQGNTAHVVVMPHVTADKLDNFINELVQKRLLWFQDGKRQPLCIAAEIGAENCVCPLHK
ncbi:hypothetical protein Nepgr_023426 [Nepenthes gracilis]|uniref:Histidine decarboxylase n=1 Tax=Nepenthes gracilis TaxID=150966 RepID=A0AAD3XZ12_NEPGR|nr:hypothetical protein Nepgr_023426 [Nepenthes gracilis]